MPYTRVYLNRKSRKTLKRLAEIYGETERDLITILLTEYHDLMLLFEVEVGDRYSLKKFAKSQKSKLGALPTIEIPSNVKAKLNRFASEEDQSSLQYISRMVAMGLDELEYDLWWKAAEKEFRADKNLSKKQLKKNPEMYSEFYDWADTRPGQPESFSRLLILPFKIRRLMKKSAENRHKNMTFEEFRAMHSEDFNHKKTD